MNAAPHWLGDERPRILLLVDCTTQWGDGETEWPGEGGSEGFHGWGNWSREGGCRVNAEGEGIEWPRGECQREDEQEEEFQEAENRQAGASVARSPCPASVGVAGAACNAQPLSDAQDASVSHPRASA
jgi:hypothetical protein